MYFSLSLSQTYIPTHSQREEYYSTIKNAETQPFATKLMGLEGIMLSETSQTKTYTSRSHLHVESNSNDNESHIKLTEKRSDLWVESHGERRSTCTNFQL